LPKLSVNLNKIALIRNSRDTKVPSVLEAAEISIEAGADGITVHPRPDLRHITPYDIMELSEFLSSPAYQNIEFNIEGNPMFEEGSNGYPGFIALVQEARPDQCTLVPDSNDQLTSDHGWDFSQLTFNLKETISRLRDQGIRVSGFVDPDPRQIGLAKKKGFERIELYTGPYAQNYGTPNQNPILSKFILAAEKSLQLEMNVNAGHDLNQTNLPLFIARMPEIKEVSIGHAIVSEAIYHGLRETVKTYKSILDEYG